jgi:peptidoglycan hydrolase CwlO-like protein
MNLKLVIAVAAIAAMPVLAHAQRAAAPKGPSKADAQKVVNMIKADKAKLDTYCQISKLGDQAQAAAQKKDQKKMDDLNKQADELGQKIGPDYVKLMAGMENVNPDSKDGKELVAILDSLDAMCPK